MPAARLDENDREQRHSSAIDRWVAGDWQSAARDLDRLLERHPTDLLALFVGHQLDFFLGDATQPPRPGRPLHRHARPGHDHQGFLLGMQASGWRSRDL